MNPIKSMVPLAKWLLRIALAIVIYQKYYGTVLSFSFNNLAYILALLYVVFAVTLIIGGFLSNARLTVISGLVILAVSVVKMFLAGVSIDSAMAYFTPAAIGFYFMARGNKG